MPAPNQRGMQLRPATGDDARLLFEWANDPQTRAASFNSDPIAWDTHVDWLQRRLNDRDTRIWIGEVDGDPVGQVRFQRDGGEWEISVVVAPDARGNGHAASLIAAGTRELGEPIVARIKPANEASIRAFEKAGYRLVDDGDPLVYEG